MHRFSTAGRVSASKLTLIVQGSTVSQWQKVKQWFQIIISALYYTTPCGFTTNWSEISPDFKILYAHLKKQNICAVNSIKCNDTVNITEIAFKFKEICFCINSISISSGEGTESFQVMEIIFSVLT